MTTPATDITTSALVDQQHLVRERLFVISRPTTTATLDILESILRERATGKLTINVSQGGIQNVKFEERSQIFLDK